MSHSLKMLQVQVMWPQAGGSIHHACWLFTSHAYELMAPLGDQEVELPPIYLTEPLWGGNKGMDRKELILLLSLLPNVYVHAFFHSFELFWKNGSSQLECQDAAVSWRVVELANNLLISNVLHLVNYFIQTIPKITPFTGLYFLDWQGNGSCT